MCIGVRLLVLGAGGHFIIFSLGKTVICLCEMILLALWAPGMLASHE